MPSRRASVLRDNLLWFFADSGAGACRMRCGPVTHAAAVIGLACLTASCTPPIAPPPSPGCLIHLYTGPDLQGAGIAVMRDTPELAPALAWNRFPRPGSSGAHGGCSRRRTTRTSWAITRLPTSYRSSSPPTGLNRSDASRRSRHRWRRHTGRVCHPLMSMPAMTLPAGARSVPAEHKDRGQSGDTGSRTVLVFAELSSWSSASAGEPVSA